MTQPPVPNSDNSPAGLGNGSLLNLNGVGNGNQANPLSSVINAAQTVNLDPFNQPPVMKTLVYSPDVKVVIANNTGQEYDVSDDLVRGTLLRKENSASTFVCELANHNGQYTKRGGLFSRMDRITVYMKRINWVQVFSGYLDTVPWAQMWAGNVTLKATCTLKRLLYTYWNPNLAASQARLMGMGFQVQTQVGLGDSGVGDVLGNLICWVGGWSPANVHIQDFPLKFFQAMQGEFQKVQRTSVMGEDAFKTTLLGYDHSPGSGSAAGIKYLSTGPGLGPQVIGVPAYKQQVLKAVDDRGMGPITSDIQNSYLTEQLSATGQGTKEAAVAQAFQQNASLGQAIQTQARNSDAAILAFACVLVESQWMNWANPMIPESLKYPHESIQPPGKGTAMGLFGQVNQGWGTVAQRMNPYASAGMFLDALAKVSGWRNMDPSVAIALAQGNPDRAPLYAPAIAEATQEVSAIRAGQGKYTPQTASIAGVNLSSLTSLVAGQSIVGAGVSALGTVGVSQNSPSPGSVPVTTPGRPQPDAQGAVNCALTCIGRPYVWGAKGPAAFDCSGLIEYCYRSIGLEVGPGTSQQATSYREKVPSLALAVPGDVIQINGGSHTVMLTAPGTIIEAPGEGQVVRVSPIYFPPTAISGIYRYCNWGGPGPDAVFNPVAGPGMPVGVGGTGSGIAGGTGSESQQEPIARNLFSYFFTPAHFAPTIANFFSGEKSFLDCQPLIQEIQAVTKAGLRNFCSAPNGDFVAYYPDYFGVDDKPVTMTIEDIEMKDVRINLTDDALTTHVYVSGDQTFGLQPNTSVAGWLNSCGVATVENETLFQRLKQVVPGNGEKMSGAAILQKYGVRPIQMEFNMIANHYLEFLVACQLFMQKWAEQYETTASFTFMPELFPGMRVALANTGIAVYVSEVTHNFDWEQGFSTTARIMAPSSVNGATLVDTVSYKIPADATQNSVPTSVPYSG